MSLYRAAEDWDGLSRAVMVAAPALIASGRHQTLTQWLGVEPHPSNIELSTIFRGIALKIQATQLTAQFLHVIVSVHVLLLVVSFFHFVTDGQVLQDGRRIVEAEKKSNCRAGYGSR